jgi:glycosyltransferase involved in cell wall biosynthesis
MNGNSQQVSNPVNADKFVTGCQKNMKILMLNHEFPPVGGGAAPVTYELCKQLVLMGNSVDVVTMRYGKLPAHEVADGINIYRTPAIRKRPNICYTHEMATYFPGAFFKTTSLCRQRKYDIIHCHFIVPGGLLAWAASRLAKVPFVVTCHGSDVPGYNPDRFGVTHKLMLPVWRKLAKAPAELVSPSKSLSELIQKNCPSAKVRIVPNGIYTDRFSGGVKTKSILMCSRILPRKGFQYVIKAIKDLALDWEVNIVGQGPYLDELKRLAEGSRTPIKFHGWLDNNDPQFYRLFKEAAIFVFPSEAENFPSVLLEASSASAAIITSTAGGCPEVVGDTAILVEPGDVEAIRENILKLVESPQLRCDLAEAANKRVQRFSWPRIAQEYLDCYKDVIECRKK